MLVILPSLLHGKSGASVFGCVELVCMLGSLGLGCELLRKSCMLLVVWAPVELVEGQVVICIIHAV